MIAKICLDILTTFPTAQREAVRGEFVLSVLANSETLLLDTVLSFDFSQLRTVEQYRCGKLCQRALSIMYGNLC